LKKVKIIIEIIITDTIDEVLFRQIKMQKQRLYNAIFSTDINLVKVRKISEKIIEKGDD